MGVLVKTSLFICILWGIHIWIKQVIDTEENNQKMEETLENMNHSYVEFQGKISEARKYRHDIPKHLHMMEQAVSDIIDSKNLYRIFWNLYKRNNYSQCCKKRWYRRKDNSR